MCPISKTSGVVAVLHIFYVCYLFAELFVSICSKSGTVVVGTGDTVMEKTGQNQTDTISNLDELNSNGGKREHATQQQQKHVNLRYVT